MDAKPFIKWAGGKRSLLPTLLEHLPDHFETYYEPFLGGGALFWELANRQAFTKAVLNDINSRLVNVYRVLRNDYPALKRRLALYARSHARSGETSYYLERARTKFSSPVHEAAWFIYVNRTCFNGLWRVNSKGVFNVPFGYYKNPTICDAPLLEACTNKLANARFKSEDFMKAVAGADRGDVVYFDPPYLPRTTNFTKYHEDDFGLAEHIRLRDCALVLKKRGVHVLISNSGAPEIYDLYKKGFTILEVQGRRSIGATADRRGHMPDVLIK